ncbi:MAG: hypothetical protein COT84_04145 [Chlamydiae bacterium CG10_big_fil_rev_8_21_14_0_10_35_9]|nr:MAG: hypothetical protein COT84_04145 [Chlamydiae bacterium CG10_big_fil_rev_8_21_14_0_10_35_9]
MQVKWKMKHLLASSVAAVLAVSNAYAIPRGPCDQPPVDVCCEDPKPGPFAFAYPKDVGLACPRDFYFAADFIAFQAKEDGLDFAITNTSGAQDANTIGTAALTGGAVQGFSNDDDNWDWGFGARVNIGFYLNHDAWNIDAEWTYLKTNQDESATVKGDGRMLPFWLAPEGFPAAAAGILPEREASARWKLTYNTLDISLGKPHHISRYVIFNPHFGVRAAWIDQDYLARYGGSFTDGATTQLGAEMNAKNDIWSVGLRAGLRSEWLLGSGFTIFGNVAGSILFTKYDIDQSTSQANNSYTISYDYYSNIPNFEVLLGLGWNTLFNKDQNRVSLRLAYEFHQWWNINQLRRFFDNQNWSANDKVSRGDLTLNGLSFRVGFDF